MKFHEKQMTLSMKVIRLKKASFFMPHPLDQYNRV
jgi:hypothetical protein